MANNLYIKDGKLTVLGKHFLDQFLEAAEACQGAKPRTPRFTASGENVVIRGVAAGSALIAEFLAAFLESDHDLAPHLEE